MWVKHMATRNKSRTVDTALRRCQQAVTNTDELHFDQSHIDVVNNMMGGKHPSLA